MKKIQWCTLSSRPNDILLLLKRHPKYFSKLHFSSSDLQKQRIFSKFKSLKILKSFDFPDYTTEFRNLLILAFKSQRNCLKVLKVQDLTLAKYYPKLQTFSLCSKLLESWRTFLRLNCLKELTLEWPYVKNSVSSSFGKGMGRIKNFSLRFWQHFGRLRYLKEFHINLYNKLDPEVLSFLMKLDSLKDELGSLQKFSLFLSHLDVDSDIDFDFVNIYKYLTCFRIHESSFATTQKLLDHLEYCQRLESLNVLKNLSHNGDLNQLVDFRYFRKLRDLEKIEKMDIAINFGSSQSFLNFLEHFTLPKSIESLKLSFYEANWTALISSDQLENLKNFNAFESNTFCQNFYEKWQNLSKLESLALCFCERSSSMTPSLYFTAPILKNLVNLKELYFGNWVNSFSLVPNIPEKIKALNLYYLWDALIHMKSSLRKLYIDSSAISLRRFPVEFMEDEKLCLEELGLCGLLLGDFYIETISKVLNKRFGSVGNHTSRLEIESIIVDNKGSLSHLMDVLTNLSKKVQVSVSIDLRNINSEDFIAIATKALQKIMDKRFHTKIDFNRIPELPPVDLKNFKKLFREYKASIMNSNKGNLFAEKQRNPRGVYHSPEDVFEESDDSEEINEEMMNFEEIGEEFEDDSSEIMEEEDELLEDCLEEIDEDI